MSENPKVRVRRPNLGIISVRILSSEKGTDAIVRVLIETKDQKGSIWTTVGVSTNIIDASYNALRESLIYKLIKSS